MDEVQEIVKKSECLLGGQQVGGWWSLVTSLKMRWGIDTLVDALEVLDKKGDDVLSRHVMSYARGLFRGNLLPVEAVVGQVASNTLVKLEYLLQNDKVGRIAIHGVEGVGKTFLMKHLHNSAVRWVDRFDHVFWITFPDQFTIKNVQSAVAAAVNCDLASDDDLNVRARKLSDKLASFVSFALFLDGVPEVGFSLNQIGISVPEEGSKCKLVLTTNSTLKCRLLDQFQPIKVEPLGEEEAYELFVHKAYLGKGLVPYLDENDDIPCSISNRCCGVPRKIVNIANRLCGIDDLHECRFLLYELGWLTSI
ncbi:probable disease resistance protein At1g61300 isoform X1 [Chenopodium quinoa]|nr:probable disease resistance protein At1g61300 isoform X1 [Chenopodium quinoa]XP_021761894.1 probable disease resistance protein At1g61300 isoform X1 [Chenopodium quinoa]